MRRVFAVEISKKSVDEFGIEDRLMPRFYNVSEFKKILNF